MSDEGRANLDDRLSQQKVDKVEAMIKDLVDLGVDAGAIFITWTDGQGQTRSLRRCTGNYFAWTGLITHFVEKIRGSSQGLGFLEEADEQKERE